MTKGKPATDILKQIVSVWDKNVELKKENVRLLKQVIHFEKKHEPMLATSKWARARLLDTFAFDLHCELVAKLDAAIVTGQRAPDGQN